MKIWGLLATVCVASIGSEANANTYMFSYYVGDSLRGVVAYDQGCNPAPARQDSGVYAAVMGSTAGSIYNQAYFLSYRFGGGVNTLTSGVNVLGDPPTPLDRQLYSGAPASPVFTPGSYDYVTPEGASAGKIVVEDITLKSVNLFILRTSSSITANTKSALILSYDVPSSYTANADGGFTLNNFIGSSFTGLQPNTAQQVDNVTFKTSPNGVFNRPAVTIDDFTFYQTPLFTGSNSDPDFIFTSSAANPGFIQYFPDMRTDAQFQIVQLSAGATAAAVPEPASWAMMIAGLGLAGSAMRKRTRTAVPA